MWSFGGLFIKFVDLSPLAITGLRSLGAAIVLWIYLKTPRWQWKPYFIIGVISYVGMMIMYVISIRMTSAANAIFLQFTAPIYVIILGYFLLNEKINKLDVLVMCIIFSGMILFFIDELTLGGFWGNILALGAGVALAIITVLFRKEKKHAVDLVFFGNFFTVLICSISILNSIAIDSKFESSLMIFVGVFQLGIPYVLYTRALRSVVALDAILLCMIEPILNPFWVYIFLNEPVGRWSIIGGLLVLFGTFCKAFLSQRRNQ